MHPHTSVSVVNLRPDGRAQLMLACCTRHLPSSMIRTPNL